MKENNKNMKNIKKALIYIWIFFQVLLVIAVMGILAYSAITKTPIRSLFDYDWWLLFFIADIKNLSLSAE